MMISFMKSPLVSIYICTYNRSRLLERAVKSALEQTYKNIEVVVCSDNSQDDTDRVMTRLMKKHANLKYIKHAVNKGACAARNNAIKHCDGLYITGLDDDDMFTLNRVQTFIDNASLLQRYSFISSSYQYKNEQGHIKSILCANKEITLNEIISENIVGNQIFTLKKRIESVGYFDEKLHAWQDHEMWIRLINGFGNSYRIGFNSYVIDASHDHERITKNIDRINAAYHYILNKHKRLYSAEDAYNNLKLNLFAYPQSLFSVKDVVLCLRNRGIYQTVVILLKKLKLRSFP